MIRQCFTVFDGIGPGRQRALRAAGVSHWGQLLASESVPGLSDRLCQSVRQQAAQWTEALERRDAPFFAEHLPQAEHWMLFDAFGDSVRFLDIETTGLSPGRDHVTVVGISDGRDFLALVRGQGLSAAAITESLAGCRLLVSYFGTAFDVPFLKAAFPEVRWDMPHFDLCFGGRRVGLAGGLKTVERTVGIARDDAIAEVDGYEAVRLWRAHERGNPAALKTLIDYNEADVLNLAVLAPIIYERLCRRAEM